MMRWCDLKWLNDMRGFVGHEEAVTKSKALKTLECGVLEVKSEDRCNPINLLRRYCGCQYGLSQEKPLYPKWTNDSKVHCAG